VRRPEAARTPTRRPPRCAAERARLPAAAATSPWASWAILKAEEIVERHDRYLVVEKSGDPEAEIVESTDAGRALE
jgi:hypothetical protein